MSNENLSRPVSVSDEDDGNGYKSMFEEAVVALADIDKLLGLPEDGCNDPQVTVSALADFIAGFKEMQKFRDEWIDAQYSSAALEADRAGRGVDLRAELELLVADMLQPHAFTPAHYARQIEKMLAQGNGGVRDGWIKSYPVVAGYYLVRGFCLGDNLRHALVEVRDIEGSLCCNLHERNSDDEPDDWFAVADMSDRFQWKLLAASPQPDAEGGV